MRDFKTFLRAGFLALPLSVAYASLGDDCPPADCPPPPDTYDSITVNFANLSAELPANIYVSFAGGGTGLIGTFADDSCICVGQSYQLSTITGPITLYNFASGRICISFGAPLTSADAGNGYAPNFNNPALPDYSTRWDKIELTWDGLTGAGGANLTAQDFFGIPLQINSTGNPAGNIQLTWHQDTDKVFSALGAMCDFSLNTKGNPQGAIVTGAGGVPVTPPGDPQISVLRIINPSTVTPGAGGSTGYQTFAPYLTHLQNTGGAPLGTIVQGNNGMFNAALQTYSFNAFIANAAGTTNSTGLSFALGDLVFDGSVTTEGVATPTSIIVLAADLTDSSIYGANPTYTITPGPNPGVNAIGDKAIADYMAGLNFGFVGSTVTPSGFSATLGSMYTWNWYGNNPNGINATPLSIDLAFDAAQPTQTYYNQFASYLTTVTDAYGFSYNDRLQSPLAPLVAGTEVTITILRDAPLPTVPGALDIVFQDAQNGKLTAWDMENNLRSATAALAASPGNDLKVVAVTDWDSDGNPDLVMRNVSTKKLFLWRFVGTTLAEVRQFGVLGRNSSWRVVGAGDVDGDGNKDLVWVKKNSEKVEVWRMDDLDLLEVVTPDTQPWTSFGGSPRGVADYNDDGKADIVAWYKTSNHIQGFSYGATAFTALLTATLPSEVPGSKWTPMVIRDLNGNGAVEILFQRKNTGALRLVELDATAGIVGTTNMPDPPGGSPSYPATPY